MFITGERNNRTASSLFRLWIHLIISAHTDQGSSLLGMEQQHGSSSFISLTYDSLTSLLSPSVQDQDQDNLNMAGHGHHPRRWVCVAMRSLSLLSCLGNQRVCNYISNCCPVPRSGYQLLPWREHQTLKLKSSYSRLIIGLNWSWKLKRK